MRKARKAPAGAKPSYETIAARLAKAEAEVDRLRTHSQALDRHFALQRSQLAAAKTTIETLSDMVGQRVRLEMLEDAEPLPF